MKYFDQQQKEDDQRFRMTLLRDIPYFHELYAKYHDQKWLEIAKDLGTAAYKLKRRLS